MAEKTAISWCDHTHNEWIGCAKVSPAYDGCLPVSRMRIISEHEFHLAIRSKLLLTDLDVGCVTGPGRSGAVAAVYASHILGIPFIPYGSKAPDMGKILVIDTARESGKTLRKAARKYADADPVVVAVYEEPPRVAFWYEAKKPQRFRHEGIAA